MTRRTALVVVAALFAAMSWSVVGAEAAGTWSVQSPNGFGPAAATLASVSCLSAASCVAVGQVEGPGLDMQSTLIEAFNGTRWTRQPSPNAVGQPQSGLGAVSCASATSCVAVGSSQSSDGSSRRLAERWNGTSWSIEFTPSPPGATDTAFGGVTCRAATDCTIVGAALGAPLIEHWNGSSWSIVATATPPGADSGGLAGVSCAGPSACKAVGWSTTGSSSGTLIESWNGSSWSFDSSPSSGSLTGVSCTTVTACVAVGSAANGPIAERWDGAMWRLEPAAGGPSGLAVVSCATRTDCVALGGSVAEHYNGSTWSLTTPLPQLGTNQYLSGIACVSTTNCIAVGTGSGGFAGFAVGARWNGATWSAITGIEPNASLWTQLASIACSAATNCVAVGTAQTAFGWAPAAERWNGSTWSVTPAPMPAGVATAELTGVACPSTTRCISVGDASADSSHTQPIAVIWDGTRWTLQTAPKPAGVAQSVLHSVSCPTTTMCIAVGSASSSHTLIERWNGTSWSIQSGAALPSGASALVGVTCRTTADCFATGSYGSGPLIEHWNGSIWKTQNAPNPKPQKGASLDGVTCTSATNCVAVGSAHPLGRGGRATLVEHWNGTSWTVQPSPSTGTVVDALASVSCVSASDCTAVGTATDYMEAAGIIEHWNGSTWNLQKAPLLPGTGIINLSGVTVVGGKYMAVGYAACLGKFGWLAYVARSG